MSGKRIGEAIYYAVLVLSSKFAVVTLMVGMFFEVFKKIEFKLFANEKIKRGYDSNGVVGNVGSSSGE